MENDEELKKKWYSSELGTGTDTKMMQQLLKQEQKRSKQIDKDIARAKEDLKSEFVLLLLGTGESGKSTIAKQLRIINKVKFTKEERKEYTSLVYSNVIGAIKTILKAHGPIDDPKLETIAQEILDDPYLELNSDTVLSIETLLCNESIQETMSKGAEYHLEDSAPYFFCHLRRLIADDYIPSQEDVLRCRQKTTGIKETNIVVDDAKFRIVDVGGQKNERKKWIHVFEGVTAVIFCADIASYDQTLREDGTTNRMIDSLNVFQEICSNRWFDKSDIILFLNKKDLFEEKIKNVPLSVCFPECQENHDYESGIGFIKNKYIQQNPSNKKRTIYHHVTCATNTSSMEVVFNAVKIIVLQKALEKSGLA